MEHKPKDTDSKDISKRAWYVIHTFSGYENKVKANLDKKVIAQDLGDVIFNVVVPMREESEFKDGKRRVVRKKLIPGYVMVDMIVNNYSWFVVRNTNGVCRLRKRTYAFDFGRSRKNFSRTRRSSPRRFAH